jgi:hypothetical protein
MAEERPRPTDGGSGAVEVPVIPPGAPKPPPSTAIPPSLVLGYIDLAIRGVLDYERYAQVYLSPWWAVEDLPVGTTAWKRAVLERVPLKGALHWGHLYLVVSDVRPEGWLSRLLRTPALGGAASHRPDEIHVRIRDGVQQAELLLHPTRADRAAPLEAFAREVGVRFRRQMD